MDVQEIRVETDQFKWLPQAIELWGIALAFVQGERALGFADALDSMHQANWRLLALSDIWEKKGTPIPQPVQDAIAAYKELEQIWDGRKAASLLDVTILIIKTTYKLRELLDE
ncbi:MAG TPA: hypothetical protein V6C65_03985 [Allocoleopsis sp.]